MYKRVDLFIFITMLSKPCNEPNFSEFEPPWGSYSYERESRILWAARCQPHLLRNFGSLYERINLSYPKQLPSQKTLKNHILFITELSNIMCLTHNLPFWVGLMIFFSIIDLHDDVTCVCAVCLLLGSLPMANMSKEGNNLDWVQSSWRKYLCWS